MSPKKYICCVCNKSYHYQTSFIAHMQTHRNHKPHKCCRCAGAFRVRSQLQEHLKIHSNERPYLCEVCGKSFKLLSVLKSHLTIHTREERYSCSECGKTYRYRASLYVHMHTHTGHKPHKCNQCGAAFRVKSHLIDHQRIHSGEKPYECEICSSNFSRTDGLQKHLKVHIQRGLKVDLNSSIHRAKLRARAKTRGSPKNQPEPRLSHHNEKEDNRITTENLVMCTDSQPDDETCVVVTVSSIGDGSTCSYSIEKQRDDSQVSSEIIMSRRSMPDNDKNSQFHNKRVINSTGNTTYLRKICASGGKDVKLPVCRHQPDSSQKCVSAKTAITCTPSQHKSCIDIVDIDTVPSKDATPETVVIDYARTQASGSSGRSVDILQHAESSNIIGGRKKKAKPIYIPMPKKKTEDLSSSSQVRLDDQDHLHETEGVLEAVFEVKESHLPQKNVHNSSTENTGGTCDKSSDTPPECKVQEGNCGLWVGKAAKPSQVRPQGLLRCNYCPKTFRHRSGVTAHERSHTGEKPFLCPKCGKGFSSKSNLETHARMHTGERPFLCECCGRQFSHRYSLSVHRRLHTQEKVFECGVCGKHFSHETNRNIHLKRHAGDKRFKCDFCPTAFVTKVDLQDHQRTHTKEKPYKCDQCGRKFAMRHHLTDHYKLHRGNGPYKCQFCSMSFVHVRSWKQHIQTHPHLMRETFQ